MDHQGRTSPNDSHVWWWKLLRYPTLLLWIHHWPKMTKFAWHLTTSCILSINFWIMDINSHWCKFLHQQASLRTQVALALTFFSFSNTSLEFFQWLSFKTTFLGKPLEDIKWQSSTKSVLTGASIASKTSSTCFSMSLSPNIPAAGMLDILRQSLLEYYWLAWNFRSRTTILSVSLSFTFLEMCRSDSILQNLVLSSFRLFLS